MCVCVCVCVQHTRVQAVYIGTCVTATGCVSVLMEMGDVVLVLGAEEVKVST